MWENLAAWLLPYIGPIALIAVGTVALLKVEIRIGSISFGLRARKSAPPFLSLQSTQWMREAPGKALDLDGEKAERILRMGKFLHHSWYVIGPVIAVAFCCAFVIAPRYVPDFEGPIMFFSIVAAFATALSVVILPEGLSAWWIFNRYLTPRLYKHLAEDPWVKARWSKSFGYAKNDACIRMRRYHSREQVDWATGHV